MDYLLKASAVLIIFYLFYNIFLQRETFYQSNRIFLLTGIIASLSLPLIVIPIYEQQTTVPLQDFVIAQATNHTENIETISWNLIISTVYIAGVLFFGFRFLLSLSSLIRLLISSKKEKIDGYYFIKSDSNKSPFSFFKYIVYNPNSFHQKELEQILTHEKVHAYQQHSFDVLFSQFATILFWFNPISWLYKKSLQQNLEFIADAISQEKSSCEKSYQHLLLKTSIGQNQFALTNNFYNSLIKKRIIMLHKNKSKSTNQWKFAIILPLLTAFIFTFNTKTIAQNIVKTMSTTDHNKGQIIDNDIQIAIITKDSKQADLDKIKETFSKEGVAVKFKGIKRNSSNEITGIKINVKSKQSNANFNTNSDNPIKPIKISFNNMGNNIAIGNGEMHHESSDLHFITKEGNHMIQSNEKGNQTYVFVSDDGEHKKQEVYKIKADDGVTTIKVISEEDENEHDGNVWATSANKKIEVTEFKGDGDDSKIILISSDVGVQTTVKIIDRIEERIARDKYVGTSELNKILQEEIVSLLEENHSSDQIEFSLPEKEGPFVIMVVGVNGVGKTTTIGKLAHQFKLSGKNVLLGAADTYRAAAVEQLDIWANRVGVPIVKKAMGSDPAAVSFDTLKSGLAQNSDVIILDTAGRLHNKINLMNELSKIKNVMKKVIPDAPHEILLVLDASIGQNAIEQCTQFTKATEVSALALTKLDGTAKGGVVIGISDQFKIPVKYIGIGEKLEDLQVFNRKEYVDSLFNK